MGFPIGAAILGGISGLSGFDRANKGPTKQRFVPAEGLGGWNPFQQLLQMRMGNIQNMGYDPSKYGVSGRLQQAAQRRGYPMGGQTGIDQAMSSLQGGMPPQDGGLQQINFDQPGEFGSNPYFDAMGQGGAPGGAFKRQNNPGFY